FLILIPKISPMPMHFESRWNKLREGFWFLPSALILAGFLLGNFMIRFDERTHSWITQHLSILFPGNADWAKSILTTIAAFVGFAIPLVISVTIVALPLASQQFGPRLLRNFLRDSTTKTILGVYFATGAFGFVIRYRLGDNFIPYLSLTFIGALAVLDIFLLILFVHHISASIHVSNVMARVSHDYSQAIERLFPKKLLESSLTADAPLKKTDVPPHFDK